MRAVRVLLTLLAVLMSAYAVIFAVALWADAPLTPSLVLVNVLGSLIVALALGMLWALMISGWRKW